MTRLAGGLAARIACVREGVEKIISAASHGCQSRLIPGLPIRCHKRAVTLTPASCRNVKGPSASFWGHVFLPGSVVLVVPLLLLPDVLPLSSYGANIDAKTVNCHICWCPAVFRACHAWAVYRPVAVRFSRVPADAPQRVQNRSGCRRNRPAEAHQAFQSHVPRSDPAVLCAAWIIAFFRPIYLIGQRSARRRVLHTAAGFQIRACPALDHSPYRRPRVGHADQTDRLSELAGSI